MFDFILFFLLIKFQPLPVDFLLCYINQHTTGISSASRMSSSNEKVNRLILDYFIHEGYKQAAIEFNKELNATPENNEHLTGNSTKHDPTASIPTNQFMTNIDQTNNEREFSDMVVHYYNDNKTVANDLDGVSRVHDNKDITSTMGYSSILQRQEIKTLILNGEITEAIKKISQYYPMILDLNNLLHFKLLRLNLVEMIRNHKFNNVVDQSEKDFLATILQFVRENLINKVSNLFKLLKELEITMSLLCFRFDPNIKNLEDQADLPEELKKIFSLSLRSQCYRLVNRAILNIHSNSENNDVLFESRKKESGSATKNNLADNVLEGDDELNQRKMTTTYHGPKFAEFDLSSLDEYKSKYYRSRSDSIDQTGLIDPQQKQPQHGNQEEDDDLLDDDSDDDIDVDTIEYTINSTNNLLFKPDKEDNSIKDNAFVVRDNEDDVTKLTDLSLGSRLEKLIKLWVLTEQRMVELNITPSKNFKNILHSNG